MTARVIAQDDAGNWLLFARPVRFILAQTPAEVRPAIAQASEAVRQGFCIAGFLSYEAAAGLDPVMSTHPAHDDVPLVWFGVYEAPDVLKALPPVEPGQEAAPESLGVWRSDTSPSEYEAAIQRIKDYIYAGDTYQVNYTLRLQTSFHGDPYALFCRLVTSQRSRCSVYIDTGDLAVCSASPELFFQRDGRRIVLRPMKGTAARGLTWADDRAAAETLRHSAKNRAENVMIVDMIRNDVGRIADAGTVTPSSLFAIETYPTVHQMVSTVTARTDADLAQTLEALFPCASITGAPKVRTLQIIRELERSPRGLYTGTCGYWLPSGQARFNVAIRTVVINRKKGTAECGVGGGIVWDSASSAEYAECFTKARFLTHPALPDLQVLESLRFDLEEGWFLLDEHIERASQTAAYFGYPFDPGAMRQSLTDAVAGHSGSGPLKVRWLLGADGRMQTDIAVLTTDPQPWKVAVALDACRHDDVFLFHKTTHRTVYEDSLKRYPGCRDVILVNDQGHVTESCYANVVIEVEDGLLTPPGTCGLLAGTFRAALLKRGEIREQTITPAALYSARRVWLINSVRRWIPVNFLDYPPN